MQCGEVFSRIWWILLVEAALFEVASYDFANFVGKIVKSQVDRRCSIGLAKALTPEIEEQRAKNVSIINKAYEAVSASCSSSREETEDHTVQ